MKLENQVTSLALSQRLKELGVKQESLFGHYRHSDHGKLIADIWHVDKKDGRYLLECSAFTVAELGEMLPDGIEVNETSYWVTFNRGLAESWIVSYRKNGESYTRYSHEDNKEADARAKMLIYLLENNLAEI